MRWRFLDSGAGDGVTQMAIDVGLMDRARKTGEAVLRVYAWSRPTISFGRHEAARDRFDAADLSALGIDAVRRPTGGRVLLHRREVTYSVTAPADPDVSLVDRYRSINALLLNALAGLGVRATEAQEAGTRRFAPTCFAEPSRGELTVDGRKLVGSAQLSERGAMLQHGSVLLADDQGELARASLGRVPAPRPAATLDEALGRPVAYAEVCRALQRALHTAHPNCAPLTEEEVTPLALVHRDRFASPEWTWRR